MKLISLKCPDCNARINVNPELEKIICNYCGAEIYVDDEASKLDRVENVKLKHRIKNHEQDIQEIIDKEKIKEEKLKKEWKLLGKAWICIGLLVVFTFIITSLTKSGEITCYIEDKQYYLTFKEKEDIKCPACTEETLKELNDKYNDSDHYTTSKNIESYFVNHGGYCGYKDDSK